MTTATLEEPPPVTTRRMSLGRRTIDALKPPREGRTFVYDDSTPGLALQITPNDARTWYVVRRAKGQPMRYRLGTYPAMTPEQARREAAMVNAEIAQGRNPQRERQAARAQDTFGELFESYITEHATARLEARTVTEYKRINEKLLTAWKSRALADIDRPGVAAWHARIGREHGHAAANRALAVLGAALTFALRRGYIAVHPARGVERFREESRERFISAEEMPRFLKAVRSEANRDAADAIMLMLLTGARRSNVLAMRWEDLHDLAKAPTWTIPKTKNGKPLLLPLRRDAAEILRERQGTGSPFVFPGDGAAGTLVEIKRVWGRILARAKIDDLTMHDLRRTCGSWLAASGVSLPLIGRLLGHRDAKSTQVYARLELAPLREAMGRLMLTDGKGKGKGDRS